MYVPVEFLVAFLGILGLWSVTLTTILVQSWRKLNTTLGTINDRLLVVETIVQYHHPQPIKHHAERGQ